MLGETLPAHCNFNGAYNSNFPIAATSIPINIMEEAPPGDASTWYRTCGFKSLHPGGANFAMGDGSVHFLSESIDQEPFHRLATVRRRGGRASAANDRCRIASRHRLMNILPKRSHPCRCWHLAVRHAAPNRASPCRVQSAPSRPRRFARARSPASNRQRIIPRITAETIVEGCRTDGNVQQSSTPDGGCEFRRNLVHEKTERRVRGRPNAFGLSRQHPLAGRNSWRRPTVDHAHFTAPIYRLSPTSRFWTPWRYDNQDPLTPIPMPAAVWGIRDGDPLPLASVLDEKTDRGVSLILSPEDTLLDVHLVTTTDGRVTFQRLNHRLGQGRTVRFATDIVVHEADWRGGLRWMTNRYAPYFDSPTPMANLNGRLRGRRRTRDR